MAANLYLPLTKSSLEDVLNAGDQLNNVLDELTLDEHVGLLVIQGLTKYKTAGSAERRLASLFATVSELVNRDEIATLHQWFRQLLDSEKIRAGIAAMNQLGIVCVDSVTLQKRDFIRKSGEWDYSFTQRHNQERYRGGVPLQAATSRLLTDEQSRIVRLVAADIEEPLNVQGYAGSGKSHVIGPMLEVLHSKKAGPENVLILAYTKGQLDGLMRTLPSGYCGNTFGQLAYRLLRNDRTQRWHSQIKSDPAKYRNLTPPELARYFDLSDTGNLTPHQAGQAIQDTVRNFCYSADLEVSSTHLPRRIRNLELDRPSTTIPNFILHAATQLWQEIITPTSRDFVFPMKVYHQVKLASLRGAPIPDLYTHIVVDESHDLT